jgi:hypothetical protein
MTLGNIPADAITDLASGAECILVTLILCALSHFLCSARALVKAAVLQAGRLAFLAWTSLLGEPFPWLLDRSLTAPAHIHIGLASTSDRTAVFCGWRRILRAE